MQIQDELQEKIEVLVKVLRQKNLKLSFAESVTGGLLASSVVDVVGASEVFLGSTVSYSTQSKENILAVSHELVTEKGTVDPEVALAMARGSQKIFSSDIALSTTGVAGPGQHEGKDAGTVYVGIVYSNKETVLLCKTTGTRNQIRQNTAVFCISKLLEILSY